MQRRLSVTLFLTALFAAQLAFSQSGLPETRTPMSSVVDDAGNVTYQRNLNLHFGLEGVESDVVRCTTDLGVIDVHMKPGVAPATVANFLNYVRDGDFDNSIIHRSVPGFVIQGGEFKSTLPLTEIPSDPPVVNEFNLSNVRGTIAMAKVGGQPNSATNNWFFNLVDNIANSPNAGANLDESNGGFTVFGRVIGSGMTVVDAIAALTRVDAGGSLTDLPLEQFQQGVPVTVEDFVTIQSMKEIPVYPSESAEGVLTFSVENDNPEVATFELVGSTLFHRSGTSNGVANITVTATDPHGNQVSQTFTHTAAIFEFLSQPLGRAVREGASLQISASANEAGATYQWFKDGAPLAGETSNTFSKDVFTAGDAGVYTVTAANGDKTITSSPATLTVVSEYGKLINLSTRGVAKSGAEAMFVGLVTTPGAGSLSTLIRAVGPTLGSFDVPGVLEDPKIDLISGGTVLLSNDDWGSFSDPATFAALMQSAGAFGLLDGSKDAAMTADVASGLYSAIASGPEGSSGNVIVEAYDLNRGTGPIALKNLSTRGFVGTEGEIMIAGIVIGGTQPINIVLRAVGPTLEGFDVPGFITDPKLTVFTSLGAVVAENDDWGDFESVADLRTESVRAGAFPLLDGGKDAALYLTLNPGVYSAHMAGVGGLTGVGLIEVYVAP